MFELYASEAKYQVFHLLRSGSRHAIYIISVTLQLVRGHTSCSMRDGCWWMDALVFVRAESNVRMVQ
jgi:hypothetical protein